MQKRYNRFVWLFFTCCFCMPLLAQTNQYVVVYLHAPLLNVVCDIEEKGICTAKLDLEGLPNHSVVLGHAPSIIQLDENPSIVHDFAQFTSLVGNEPTLTFGIKDDVKRQNFIAGFWAYMPESTRIYIREPFYVLSCWRVNLTTSAGSTLLNPIEARVRPENWAYNIKLWEAEHVNGDVFMQYLATESWRYAGASWDIDDLYQKWQKSGSTKPAFEWPKAPLPPPRVMSTDTVPLASAEDINSFMEPCPMQISVLGNNLSGYYPDEPLSAFENRFPCVHRDMDSTSKCKGVTYPYQHLDILSEAKQLRFDAKFEGGCDVLILNTTMFWPIQRLGRPDRMNSPILHTKDINAYTKASISPWDLVFLYKRQRGHVQLHFDQRMKVSSIVLAGGSCESATICK